MYADYYFFMLNAMVAEVDFCSDATNFGLKSVIHRSVWLVVGTLFCVAGPSFRPRTNEAKMR